MNSPIGLPLPTSVNALFSSALSMSLLRNLRPTAKQFLSRSWPEGYARAKTEIPCVIDARRIGRGMHGDPEFGATVGDFRGSHPSATVQAISVRGFRPFGFS